MQSCSVSGNRLASWLVWLWGEIYGLEKLLNEQINRFVFDIVRRVQKHLHAPLFYIHLWDRQFFIVILRGVTVSAQPEQKALCGCCKCLKTLWGGWSWYKWPFFYLIQSCVINREQSCFLPPPLPQSENGRLFEKRKPRTDDSALLLTFWFQ